MLKSAPKIPEHSHIILFDGVCNLCNGTVRFLIKRDKTALFKFAALQTETGQSIAKEFDCNGSKSLTTLFYIKNRKCFQQSTAILYILKDLGKGWQCFFPLILIPAFIRDYIYRFISRNRYKWFGRKGVCMIPTPDIKRRFLDLWPPKEGSQKFT